MYPVFYNKLKHLTCTNCKHAFSFRGAHQFRGKIPFLLECGHAICETCAKTCPTKSCGTCGIIYQNNLNEPENYLVNLYLLGLLNASQSGTNNSREPNIAFQLPVAAKSNRTIAEDIERCSECGLKAEYRCCQCNIFFCTQCYSKIHGRALQSHQKISLADNASDICNYLTSKCELHPIEAVQFHCTTCDVPACTHCLLLSHQGHSIVSQSQKNIDSMSLIEDMIEKLADMLRRIKTTEKKLAQPLTVSDASQDSEMERGKIEARITQHFTYLHGVLQNIENRYIAKLQERQNFIGNNVNAIKEQLKEQKTDVENAIVLATSALKTEYAVNVTAIINKLEEVLNLPCHLVHNSFTDEKIQLDIDESVVNSLEEHCAICLPPISNFSLARTNELPDDYVIEPIVREEIPSPVIPAIKPSQLSLSRTSLNMSMLSLRSSTTDKTQNIGLVEGSNEAVKITHIKDPSCFYTHPVCQTGELVKLHKSLAKQATTSIMPTKLEMNKIYLVRYEPDMEWYRGRVESVYKDAKDDQVCNVFYIDYGNNEYSVPITRMRNMSVESSLVPPIARRCSLYDIVPKNVRWEVDANKAMLEMIEGVSHTIMHVFKVQDKVYYVDIIKNSVGDGDYTLSLRDALIFLEYGCFITDEKLRRTSQQPLRRFFDEEVSVASNYDVRATHVESPEAIYVQKIGNGITHLNKLIEDMTDEYSQMPSKKGIIYTPQIGMPCAALYSDHKWYRGRISNLLGNRKVEVFFVDFGDTREYEYDEIRKLYVKFMSITALAFKVSLKDVAPLNSGWTLETKEFMNEHILSKFLRIFVFSRESDSYKVALRIPGDNSDINLNSLLVQEKLALSTGSSSQLINIPKAGSKKHKKRAPKQKKSAKSMYNVDANNFEYEVDESDPFKLQVNILQAESPDCIYICDIQSTKLIKKLIEEIQCFYNKFKSVGDPEWEADDICIAYSPKDKLYHRSKILEIIQPDKAIVLLYDIGIAETVSIQDLQALNPKFTTLPARALKIKLAGILPCGGSATWLSSSLEMFSDLINENQHAKFYISRAAGPQAEDNDMAVELWVRETRTDGPLAPTIAEINSINYKLVKKGVALPVRGYKDSKDKILAVELRQQLLKNAVMSMSNEIDWVPKDETTIMPQASSAVSSILGSSMENFDQCSQNEDENANVDADADVESEGDVPLPPPMAAWLAPAPIEENEFCAVGTNVDHNCTIYLHSLKQTDTLAHISAALQARYNESKHEICDLDWSVGDICIAQFHFDKKWYRAKVIEVMDSDEVKVIFVDYGNVDVLKVEELRKRVIMGHIPIQAMRCVVQGLTPDSPTGQFSVPELDVIHALLVDKMNDVTVLDRTTEGLVISVKLTNFNNRDMVTYLRDTLKLKIKKIPVEILSEEEDYQNFEFNHSDNSDVLVEGSLDYIPATLAEPRFGLGLNYESISSAIREPEICDETVTSLVNPSNDCTLIISIGSNTESSLNSDSIIEFDDGIVSPCKMELFKTSFNSTSTPQNERDDDYLRCYTSIDIPDDIEIVDLEPQFIADPLTFYARLGSNSKIEHLDTYEQRFAMMTRHMQIDEFDPPKLTNIRLNSPCCARYTADNKWYRAIITEIDLDSDAVKIQYVDYGNSECQSIDKIHCLKESWLALPMMSLKCKLWKVRVNPDKPSWKAQTSKFERVFYRGLIKARIKNRHDDILDVELYSDEECSQLLYDFLLEDGLLEMTDEE